MTASVGAAVIGIGNEYRRDDGVGHAVIALLRQRAVARPLPPGTLVRECDGDPGHLIGLWEDAALAIVVDACFPAPAHPGRIHRWGPATDTRLRCATAKRHSTHGLGLVETLHLARRLDRDPGRLVVYAVEGADRSLGTGLTPAVAEAVRPLAERIEAEILQWVDGAGRGRAAN
ncbi:hydrogenase maturation protease [Streptomyces sp. NPDC001020]